MPGSEQTLIGSSFPEGFEGLLKAFLKAEARDRPHSGLCHNQRRPTIDQYAQLRLPCREDSRES